ncbi:MAG: hypothetical protein J6P69_05050 [Bacteroidales bacterium]|nr:hypothetical protein [Bacteroidales bacterium]
MEKKLILFTLLLLLPLAAMSQDRLRSSAVFEGKVVPKDRMVETIVKGDYLKDYGLSLFRSVRMDVDDEDLGSISALILEDASDAASKGTEIDHNRLSYALIAFEPDSDGRYFLCFQSKPSSEEGTTSVIVVYMEGDTTLTNLKKMFTTK